MFKHRAVRAALVTASVASALTAGSGASAAKAAPADTTDACAPATAVWSTTSRETAYQHGPFILNSNEWNPAGGSDNLPASWMTTWAGAGSGWGVCANEAGTGWPYPEERLPLGQTPMTSLSGITSGYSDTTPSDAQYDSSYDIWLKRPSSAPGKTTPEVMVWTTNHAEWTGNRKIVGRMTIAGHRYRMSVCDVCNRVTFVFPSNVPATTVNLLAVLRYAARNPASSKIIGRNPVLTEIDRGWEIYKTRGTEAFTAHGYWLSVQHKVRL